MLETLRAWMPTRSEFMLGLVHVEREYPGIHLLHDGRVSAEEWALIEQSPKSIAFFHEVALFTGEHWEIPFSAVGLYIVLITVGPIIMSHREPLPVKNLACAWNWLLAAFSAWGVACTWSEIATRAYAYGFETTCCGHWVYMGRGPVAWAMLLFIYSKLFELLDTAFLVAKKTDVIFLHWYHHITVLLYCWHSYSTRISNGIWFAAMNYFVHALMYAYFAMTQMGPRYRKMVQPYARLITTLQISQMVVGLAINACVIYYTTAGRACSSNKTNTILSWLMYLSYFVLFALLYMRNYILGTRPARAAESCKVRKAE